MLSNFDLLQINRDHAWILDPGSRLYQRLPGAVDAEVNAAAKVVIAT